MWSSSWLPLFFTETVRPQLDSLFFFASDLEHSPAVSALPANSAMAFVGAIITHHLLQQAGELLTELETNGAGWRA